MVNVLHIINSLKIGGAERLVLDTASSRKPLCTRVITWHSDDLTLLENDSDGVLEVLALRPFTFSKLLKANKWIYNSDILHVHLFPSLYLAALIPKTKIYTEHNTWNRRRSYSFFRILDRFFYRRYDHVVAISDAVQQSLINWISRDVVPVTIIDNGIFLDRFRRTAQRTKQNIDTLTIGMAGTFTEQKNQDLLVQTLQHLPQNVCLLFAGDGPRRREVEDLAVTLCVSERVTFLGSVNDMQKYYNELDIYIQASFWEGFGLTVVEAMANGLPCLASNVPGVAEVIGDTGKLFDNDDISGLVVLIKSLIASNTKYQESVLYSLGQAEHYSIDKMTILYEQLYENLTIKKELHT